NNSAGGPKEYYYSNGGMINRGTNKITPTRGLGEREAKAMGMHANPLSEGESKATGKVAADANPEPDRRTSRHMRTGTECTRSRKEANAPARAGFDHSVANIMATEALHTGKRVSWDPAKKDIVLS